MAYEICILGAGPAGATAALHLARAGHRCLLLERAAFPRDKVCGDALSGKVLAEVRQLGGELPARLAALAPAARTWGISFYAPSGRRLDIPYNLSQEHAATRPPDGYVVRRLDFDNLLVEEVRRQPTIDLRENCDVARTERTAAGWRLFDKADHLLAECRLLLVANGAQSAFVRQVAGQPLDPAHHCAGVRAYYRGIAGLGARHFLELHFLPELLPAYLWIFPMAPGEANVGIGLLSREVARRKVHLRQTLTDLLATHPVLAPRFAEAELQGPVRGWGLPLGSRQRTLSGAGYLLLGDAGSLIDPFTGEGISPAMVSGRHAADWAGRALAAQNYSAGFLAGYDAAVYHRLGPELRLGTYLQKIARWPKLINFITNRAVSNPALAETLSIMFADIDVRARLKQPRFYWRLLFNKGH